MKFTQEQTQKYINILHFLGVHGHEPDLVTLPNPIGTASSIIDSFKEGKFSLPKTYEPKLYSHEK